MTPQELSEPIAIGERSSSAIPQTIALPAQLGKLVHTLRTGAQAGMEIWNVPWICVELYSS
jgi:hypothetical protein